MSEKEGFKEASDARESRVFVLSANNF